MLGTFDVFFMMNRSLFTQFLWRALGYAFHEVLPESLVTLRLKRSSQGVSLHISGCVLIKETVTPLLGAPSSAFRPWFLSFSLLSRFASFVNCTLSVNTCHKGRIRFACHFSKQSVEVFMSPTEVKAVA